MRSKTCLKSIAICAVIVLLGSDYAVAGTWTTIDKPGGYSTWISGISGNTLVGGNWATGDGLIYNLTSGTWATLYAPEAYGKTVINGIDGSNIVGYYEGDSSIQHGFLYNGATWTTIDKPGGYSTWISGISGNTLVGGNWATGDGLIYNLTSGTWTTLYAPEAYGKTVINGIDGSNIVGYYEGDSSIQHGFIYTIPEPATLLLFGLGAVIIRKFRA